MCTAMIQPRLNDQTFEKVREVIPWVTEPPLGAVLGIEEEPAGLRKRKMDPYPKLKLPEDIWEIVKTKDLSALLQAILQ